MKSRCMYGVVLMLVGCMAACSPSTNQSSQKESRYAALDQLPDFAGQWGAVFRGGPEPQVDNTIPFLPAAAAEEKRRQDLDKQGKPFAVSAKCLPQGGGRFWTGPEGNQIAFLPGLVLIWGHLGQDGNNLRYIHTDGRPHNDFVDSFLGDSIGHWEGDTLVIDTIAFRPDVPAAVDIENGGDMHMVERLHLVDHDTLQVDVEITAPKVFSAPYKVSRTLKRRSGADFEAKESVCLAGAAVDKVDANGTQYLETAPPADLVLPPGVKLQ